MPTVEVGLFMGDWDSTVSYRGGQVVREAGLFYYAAVDTTGDDPSISPTIWIPYTPDPLTLECFCSQPGGTDICQVTQIKFHLESFMSPGSCVGISTFFFLRGAPGGDIFVPTDEGTIEFTVGPIPAWRAAWDSIHTEYTGAGSVSQGGAECCSSPPFNGIGFYFEFTLRCSNIVTGDTSTQVVRSHGGGGGTASDCRPGEACCRVITTLNDGGGSSYLWRSSPLGGGSATVIGGGFSPSPDKPIVNIDPGRGFCVCAHGGLKPYTYSAGTDIGCAPDLDVLSGCVSETGFSAACTNMGVGPGTMTFTVIDAAGNAKSIDCDFNFTRCPAESQNFGNVFS